MRLVHPTVIYYFHDREVIIIITTTPFDVEGREVGSPTVYEVYMVSFMMGIWYGI